MSTLSNGHLNKLSSSRDDTVPDLSALKGPQVQSNTHEQLSISSSALTIETVIRRLLEFRIPSHLVDQILSSREHLEGPQLRRLVPSPLIELYYLRSAAESLSDQNLDSDSSPLKNLSFKVQVAHAQHHIIVPDRSPRVISTGSGTSLSVQMIPEKMATLFELLRESSDFEEASFLVGPEAETSWIRDRSYHAMFFKDRNTSTQKCVFICPQRGNATIVIQFLDGKNEEPAYRLNQLVLRAKSFYDVDFLTKQSIRALSNSFPQDIRVRTVPYREAESFKRDLFLLCFGEIQHKEFNIRTEARNRSDNNYLSVFQAGEFRGFASPDGTDEVYAPIATLERYLNVGHHELKKIAQKLKLEGIPIISLNGTPSTAYPLSPIQAYLNHKNTLITTENGEIRVPFSDGEFKGLWIDQNTGAYYGSLTTIAERKGISKAMLLRIMRDHSEFDRIKETCVWVKPKNGDIHKAYRLDLVERVIDENVPGSPRVAKATDGNNWRGFYFIDSDESSTHYGTLNSIAVRLGLSNEVLRYLQQQSNAQAISILDLTLQEREGYSFEFFESYAKRLGYTSDAPSVESHGEYKGFYRDTTQNPSIYYGTLKKIAEFLSLGIHTLKGWVSEYPEPPRLIKVEGRLCQGYSLEYFESYSRNINYGLIPRVATQGEFKGFYEVTSSEYTEPSKCHFGSIEQIERFLKGKGTPLSSTLVQNIISKHDISSLPILSLFNKSTTGYSLEAIIKVAKQLGYFDTPQVESEGDWRGFYCEPNTNEHYGSRSTIQMRLGITRDQAMRLIENNPVRAIKIKDQKGKIRQGYSYEHFYQINQNK
jgi:hypothetical protein